MKLLVKPINAAPRLESRTDLAAAADFVTVQVKFVGLCRTDLRVASGELEVSGPIVLGHESSGVVLHDAHNIFAPGDAVAINPVFPDGQFMGLHFDGALQDLIHVPASQLVPAGDLDLKVAAYLEPVAASMAVLKARIEKHQKGVIYHLNRISHLTFLILTSLGYDLEWVQEAPSPEVRDRYDYAIETVFEQQSIHAMLGALKPGGLLVVKSRQYTPTAITPAMLVAKELTLQAVNYYDFTAAMEWLRENQALLAPLLGAVYPLDNWEAAFDAASAADAKKIFVRLG